MAQNREEYIISLIDQGVTRGLKNIQNDINKVRGNMDGLQTKVGKNESSGLMGAFGGLGKMVAKLGIAYGAVQLAKSIVSLGANMEQTRVAFTTFTGSAEVANALLEQMNEFANVTPFDNAKVIQSARTLMAFGTTAGEIQDTLKILGDVSAGTGKDLNEMAVIFGQVKSTGKLMGQDLLQLINAGFNPLQEISRTTGKSVGQLKDEMSKGMISFEMVENAFRSATSEGGLFNDMMKKQSETLTGKWSTMMGKLQTAGIAIGEKIIPILSGALDGVLRVFEIIRVNWEKIVGIFEPIRQAIQPLIDSFRQAGENLGFINEQGESTIGIMDVLNGIFTGIAWVIENILAPIWNTLATAIGKAVEVVSEIVGAFMQWYEKTEWIKKTLGGLVAVVKGVFERIKRYAINILGGVGDLLIGIFTLDMDKIKSAMGQFGQAFMEMNPVSAGMGIAKDFAKGYKKGLQVEKVSLIDPEKTTEQNKKTSDILKKTTTGLPTSPGSVTKSGLKAGISEVKAGAPKTFNININSLIKEQNFETVKDMTEMKNIIRNEVSRLLLGVVNDVQTT